MTPSEIATDSLIRFEESSGNSIWRVICPDHRSGAYVFAQTPIVNEREATVTSAEVRKLRLVVRKIPFGDTYSMIERELFVPVEGRFEGAMTQGMAQLSSAAQREAQWRISVMSCFLDPQNVMENFRVSRNFGPLVRQALMKAESLMAEETGPRDLMIERSIGKPLIYIWLKCLIVFGFKASSLHPRFDERGCSEDGIRVYGHGTGRRKPGRRSVAERLERATFSQNGLSREDQARIIALGGSQMGVGGSYRKAYDTVLSTLYSERVADVDGHGVVRLRPSGEYPTFDQFRYVVNKGITALDRFVHRTTKSHFQRTLRGLHGCSRDGVLGPGHVYAIDSTVADVFLRSGIDRTLFVGRPIVYWVVDVWTTAIVGVYVCLAAPSWRQAKCALFCTVAGGELLTRLYGFEVPNVLQPAPALMARLLCDRGEYLSEGARQTAETVGYSVEYNPSYRPDLRGTGERFHRVAKDKQFGFVPGAFDARRKELELRPNSKAATLTLPEYCAYLNYLAAEYNLTANRERLYTAELGAAGVDMTPAGLWTWGHEVGLGYRRAISQDDLVRSFLCETPLKQQKNGIYLDRMRYLLPEEQAELACQARTFGRFTVNGYTMPAVAGHVFADLPGVTGVTLLEQAPVQAVGEYASFFDYADADALRLVNATEGRHAIDGMRLNYRERMQDLVDGAIKRTEAVKALAEPPQLSVREARQQEMTPQSAGRMAGEPAVKPTCEDAPQGRIGTLIGKMVGAK